VPREVMRLARLSPARNSITMNAGAIGLVAEVEDLDDAGVLDRGRGPGLVEEPIDDGALAGRRSGSAP
jgi:hypothetical protein